MSVPFLIIDGYNLLHAAGLARVRYGRGDLERARQRLLGMLCEKLPVAEQMRCTVVFDAHAAPGDTARESKHHELRVLFAPSGTDADSTIELMVARHSAPRQILLISSDHRLHQAARRRGATPMDSEPFWERLQARADVRSLSIPEPAPAKPKPATQADDWLREFGEISVPELAAEVHAELPVHTGQADWVRHLMDLERTLADPAARKSLEDDPRRRPGS